MTPEHDVESVEVAGFFGVFFSAKEAQALADDGKEGSYVRRKGDGRSVRDPAAPRKHD